MLQISKKGECCLLSEKELLVQLIWSTPTS